MKEFETFEIPAVVPGCNMKTGLYGLFLCALEDVGNSPRAIELLDNAVKALDVVTDCTVEAAFNCYYPLAQDSTETILGAAESVLEIERLVGDSTEDKVSEDIRDSIIEFIDERIPMRKDMVDIEQRFMSFLETAVMDATGETDSPESEG